VMHQGDSINGEYLQKLLNIREKKPQNNSSVFNDNIFEYNYNKAKEVFEKQYLEFHISNNHGIISKTAEAIGIYPSNLHAKLRKYNITTASPAQKI